jgi:transcriptional regulator with XRE-family HTH domain
MAEQRPTVVRRQLGRRLKQYRERAGKTHDDVTEADIASRSKMWKIESGRIPVRQGDILALARLYDLTGPETDELLSLAAASKDTGFLESYGASVPEWGKMYADLESAASELWIYNSEIMPGLLQCPSYARCVISADETLDAHAVDERVQFRATRYEAFFDRQPPGTIRAVLTAGALRLHVGQDEQVMEEQLVFLRALINEQQVSLRILSPRNGLHTAMRGPFTVLKFDDPADPSLGYVESVVGARYFERPEHVNDFEQAFQRVWRQAAELEEYIDEH